MSTKVYKGELIKNSFFDILFNDQNNTFSYNGKEIVGIIDIIKPLSKIIFENSSESQLQSLISKEKAVLDSIYIYEKEGIEIVSPEFKGYLHGYFKFKKESPDLEIIGSNLTIYNKQFNYAGRVDKLFFNTKTKESIIGIVSIGMPCTALLYPLVNAYAKAMSGYCKVSKAISINLLEHGNYSVSEIAIDEKGFDVVRACLKISKYLKSTPLFGGSSK